MAEFRIETERLILRAWREEDVCPFYSMSQDASVMEFIGSMPSLAEVSAHVARIQAKLSELGHWFWAMENKENGSFMGFCGVKPVQDGCPVSGRLEVGWRLAHRFWGQGYAREAAQASLTWGFANLSDDAIWAITVPANTRSWGLMERIGMSRHLDLDFDHPSVPDGSPLKRHITYSIRRDEWKA
jgi:RimJ/RimL family protein N-acetyltransferase